MMTDKRFVRKISQQGNSLAVSLPKEIVNQLDLEKGHDMEILFNEERGEIQVKKLQSLNEGFKNINPKVLETMNRVMDEYKDMYKNLKDR